MKIANFHQVLAPIAACTATLLLLASPLAHADESQEVAKLYRQGNLAQALTRADAYLTSRPKDAQMRFHKGLILAEQNKIADAIKIFSSLSADYPNLPEPYNNLAVLYANQGQYEKAKGALEAAIRTHPSYSTAHENLGDIYAKMASQAYDKALQLDKSNAAAQTKLTLIKDLFTEMYPKASKSLPPHRQAPHQQRAPEKIAERTTEKPAAEKPVAEKPTVIEKPMAEKSITPAGSEEIIKTVNAWAKAWSDKNVAAYLGFYASDFQPPGGVARAAWEKGRQERIDKPKSIQVSIANLRVTLATATQAKVTFKQSYYSDSIKNHTTKTLVLVMAGGKWLIQQEQVGQ